MKVLKSLLTKSTHGAHLHEAQGCVYVAFIGECFYKNAKGVTITNDTYTSLVAVYSFLISSPLYSVFRNLSTVVLNRTGFVLVIQCVSPGNMQIFYLISCACFAPPFYFSVSSL